MTRHSDLAEFAPAKVNLTLHVLGRRADGYHEIESLVVFADVGDRLTFVPGGTLALDVSGPTAQAAGAGGDNLVLKAARALAERVEGLRVGAFRLDKQLPVAAGLGGGSSDAAAALRLLARQNGLSLDDARLREAARVTGADVPVCLDPRARMMRGIGEILSDPVTLPDIAGGAGQSRRRGADQGRVRRAGGAAARVGRAGGRCRGRRCRCGGAGRVGGRGATTWRRPQSGYSRSSRTCSALCAPCPAACSRACRDRARPASACSLRLRPRRRPRARCRGHTPAGGSARRRSAARACAPKHGVKSGHLVRRSASPLRRHKQTWRAVLPGPKDEAHGYLASPIENETQTTAQKIPAPGVSTLFGSNRFLAAAKRCQVSGP